MLNTLDCNQPHSMSFHTDTYFLHFNPQLKCQLAVICKGVLKASKMNWTEVKAASRTSTVQPAHFSSVYFIFVVSNML